MATARHLQPQPVETTDCPTASQGEAELAADTVMPSGRRLYTGASRRLSLVRQYCLRCAGGTSKLVAECPGEFAHAGWCPLWPWRFGVSPATAIRHGKLPERTPFGSSLAKAIREHCLQCCAGSAQEVRMCPSTDCKLWEWRFGVRPETARRRGKPVARVTSEAGQTQKGNTTHGMGKA
ncbi:hypothetical protein LLH23_15115 [bacterium]|nr:hypothetical protein [bacterium]